MNYAVLELLRQNEPLEHNLIPLFVDVLRIAGNDVIWQQNLFENILLQVILVQVRLGGSIHLLTEVLLQLMEFEHLLEILALVESQIQKGLPLIFFGAGDIQDFVFLLVPDQLLAKHRPALDFFMEVIQEKFLHKLVVPVVDFEYLLGLGRAALIRHGLHDSLVFLIWR